MSHFSSGSDGGSSPPLHSPLHGAPSSPALLEAWRRGEGMSLLLSPQLPRLSVVPARRASVRIGNSDTDIIQGTDNTDVVLGLAETLHETQAGCVYLAATVACDVDPASGADVWAYVQPYERFVVKAEQLSKIQQSLLRLNAGAECDNSYLDKIVAQLCNADPVMCGSVPQLFACWYDTVWFYSVWEWCAADLRDRIGMGMDEHTARIFMTQLAQAVHGLHAHIGFCHRDISPENVLIRVTEEGEQALLIDFGTARRLERFEAVALDADEEDELASLADCAVDATTGLLESPASAMRSVSGVGAGAYMYSAPLCVHGIRTYDPPPSGGAFCKPRYADPLYVRRARYSGVGYDIWSLAQTLFTCVQGVELYRHPERSLDREYAAVEDHEAAMFLFNEMTGKTLHMREVFSPASELTKHLTAVNMSRVRRGLPELSDALIDLLLKLFRVRPGFRPYNAEAILEHPWIVGRTSPRAALTMFGEAPAGGEPHEGAEEGDGGGGDGASKFPMIARLRTSGS